MDFLKVRTTLRLAPSVLANGGIAMAEQRRISVEGNSFLDENALNRLLSNSYVSLPLAEAAVAVVRYGNDFVRARELKAPYETNAEKQRVFAIVILVRILEVCEAIVNLSAHGFRSEGRSLFRVFLDAYFILACTCRNAGFIEQHVKSDEKYRLKFMNVARQSDHEIFAGLNEYASDEVVQKLDHKIKDEGIQESRSKRHAQMAGCEILYDSMYRLCSRAVHTSPRCLMDYVREGGDGYIEAIIHRPNPEEASRVLYDMAYYLVVLLRGICDIFEIDDRSDLDTLEAALNAAVET